MYAIYIELGYDIPHNFDYVVFLFIVVIVLIFEFVYGVFHLFHTMFVKGFCEIFLKLSNTAANRAFAVALCVLFRFPLYKYGWFPQMNDQVYQQVLQCLFASCKMSLQINV